MKIENFLSSWQGTMAENKFHRFTSVSMLGIIVLLAVNAILKDKTVVIAPPELTKAVEVSRSAASQDYLEAWTWSVGMLLGNATPANAGFIKNGLEPMLAPEIFSEVTTALDRQIHEIQRERITSRFDPRKIVFETETQRYFVTGYRVVGGPAATEKREEATYEMRWEVRSFRPQITHLTTYSGRPQTKEDQERRDQIDDRNKRLEEQRHRMQEGK